MTDENMNLEDIFDNEDLIKLTEQAVEKGLLDDDDFRLIDNKIDDANKIVLIEQLQTLGVIDENNKTLLDVDTWTKAKTEHPDFKLSIVNEINKTNKQENVLKDINKDQVPANDRLKKIRSILTSWPKKLINLIKNKMKELKENINDPNRLTVLDKMFAKKEITYVVTDENEKSENKNFKDKENIKNDIDKNENDGNEIIENDKNIINEIDDKTPSSETNIKQSAEYRTYLEQTYLKINNNYQIVNLDEYEKNPTILNIKLKDNKNNKIFKISIDTRTNSLLFAPKDEYEKAAREILTSYIGFKDNKIPQVENFKITKKIKDQVNEMTNSIGKQDKRCVLFINGTKFDLRTKENSDTLTFSYINKDSKDILTVTKQDVESGDFDFVLHAAAEKCFSQQVESYNNFLKENEVKVLEENLKRTFYNDVSISRISDHELNIKYNNDKIANVDTTTALISGNISEEDVNTLSDAVLSNELDLYGYNAVSIDEYKQLLANSEKDEIIYKRIISTRPNDIQLLSDDEIKESFNDILTNMEEAKKRDIERIENSYNKEEKETNSNEESFGDIDSIDNIDNVDYDNEVSGPITDLGESEKTRLEETAL